MRAPALARHPVAAPTLQRPRRSVLSRASEAAAAPATEGLLELNQVGIGPCKLRLFRNSALLLITFASTSFLPPSAQDTFYPYLEQQGSTLVVVDFFTDW